LCHHTSFRFGIKVAGRFVEHEHLRGTSALVRLSW
jgi:hypothetical protein